MKTNDAETKSAATDSQVGPHRGKPSRLWLWFVAAFLIQGAAWTAWFVIASKHQVQEVPLEGAVSTKR